MGRKHINAMLETLHSLGKQYNVQVTEPAPGHFQLRGALLVNYYPLSKKQTAYVAGTKEGRHRVSPIQAMEMTRTAPPVVPPVAREPRQGRLSRPRRKWLMDKGVTCCHWCQCELTLDNSTLEHIISLARGGLDQPSNWALACYPCNQDRGHNMPELAQASKPTHKPVQVIADGDLYEKRRHLVKSLTELHAQRLELEPKLGRSKQYKLVMKTIWQVKARIKSLNVEISETESKRYHATFREVAKDLLSPELFDRLSKEAARRDTLSRTGDTHGLHSPSNSPQPEPRQRNDCDRAIAVLASHSRRSDDAQSVQS